MTIEKLSSLWREAGVCDGDILLIHSNVRRTIRKYKVSPKEILESFIKAVGVNGTVLLPLFNFDFCNGKSFDIKNTTSQMGVLTEIARNYADAVRTGHPVYSFAVIGKHAKEFEDICNISAYGKDSPFAKLHEMGGKIAILDLPDQNSMTFYHYVEEILQVPYRFFKSFKGQYTDAAGHSSLREFTLYVRDIDKGVETYVDNMQDILWEEGLYSGDKEKQESGLRVISAIELFKRTKEVIESGAAENILYRINKERIE